MPVLVPVAAPSCGKTLAQRRLGLEAEVGIALCHCFVPILTTPMQINQLRSFPSEIRVSALFAKSKNYLAIIHSSSLHSSATIHLLELLLEVVLVSSKFLRARGIIPSRMMQSFDNLAPVGEAWRFLFGTQG